MAVDKNERDFFDATLNDGIIRNSSKVDNADRIAGTFFDYELISAVFDILYERNGDETSINLALKYLCQKYDADRSYIFESLDNGASYNNTFEFCKEGISSEIEGLQNIPKESFVDFIAKAHNGIIYTNNLRETLEHDTAFEVMAGQGIISFVHAQVKRDGEMTFFIGLDDCTKTRVWTEREINSLQYIGKLLSIILQGAHLRDEVNKLAESNRNSTQILDSIDSVVYVSDTNTYELLHLNLAAKEVVGLKSDDEWKGKKCYKILQGKDAPCEFCTNHLLNTDSYYEWSFYNPMLRKSFLLKDSLISFEGRIARLEIATDISKVTELEKELKEKLVDEQFISSCVELLHSGKEPDVSIDLLLNAVAQFYDADRSYIFELSEDRKSVSNTYEFARKDEYAIKDKFQNIPTKHLEYIFNKFKNESAFYQVMENMSAGGDADKEKLMAVHMMSSVILSSIFIENDDVTGFVGVDNPKVNLDKVETIGSVAKFIASFLDQTELITVLKKLSFYDTLTGSKNRHSYNIALKNLDKKHIESMGVLYIDIAKLKAINDSKGVLFGDEILIRLASLLRNIFGEDVYRVGGDEFVVLKENISEKNFEDNILALKKSLSVEKDFTASLGYTWNKNFESLSAKIENLYDGEKYTRILAKNLEMEIINEKFVVYLQPQISFASGKTESAEALVRRYDASGAIQPPNAFIPFYEKEGIVSKIDLFVLETICKTIKTWNEAGYDNIDSIAVNCSRMTIAEKGIVESFSYICDSYGIPHDKIVVEITETINGITEKVLSQIIKDFSDAGFLVSLDDFGSGYSNLTSLIVSDFDEVKLDMRLINDIEKDEKSRALTEVAITLCDKLNNLVSVAEGVESSVQCDILKEMGCIKGQGYYFDRPMKIEDFKNKYIVK